MSETDEQRKEEIKAFIESMRRNQKSGELVIKIPLKTKIKAALYELVNRL